MKKYILTGMLLPVYFLSFAQKVNWQNLDLAKDSVFGISTERAYSELLAGKKAQTVIVAVIDMGVDTTHEDIKPNLWTDPKNSAHGWNFIGDEKGPYDITVLAGIKKTYYDSLAYTGVPDADRAAYQENRGYLKEYQDNIAYVKNELAKLTLAAKILDGIVKKIGKDDPTVADFKAYIPPDKSEKNICDQVITFLPLFHDYAQYHRHNIEAPSANLQYEVEHAFNLEDVKNSTRLPNAGNNDVCGPFVLSAEPGPQHGTNVAGTIAAVRHNGIGIDGVADHVQIMALRAISTFEDIRDENIARAIRYAVDNGAKIINMSFATFYTLHPQLVNDAVKYAMAKDVLIVTAAGNDSLNLDKSKIVSYPSRIYKSGGQAQAWINVGASGYKDNNSLVASFSDYGKTTVDVFAPGVHVYTTVPGSRYEFVDGTSIAAPVVAGLAALIREYYPKLTAVQVKDVIMRSVVKRPVLADKCISGGVINAYNALKLAATYK